MIRAVRAIREKRMELKKTVQFCSFLKTTLCQIVHEATVSVELVVEK
jgi:hypothetical protein